MCLQDTLNKILLDEMQQLEDNINSEEKLLDELLEELRMQYLNSTEDEEVDDLFENLYDDVIFCPCCLKNPLRTTGTGFITCNCGLRYIYAYTCIYLWKFKCIIISG